MEKHKCKLCLRSFSNGRALGGHMRSHMMNLPIPPKPEEPPPSLNQLSESESASSSSSSSSEEEEEEMEDAEKGVFYGLRENPKRSIRLVDPEFSFAAVDAGSVVLQDRESETESSKNPSRRRSKRTRILELKYHHHEGIDQEQEDMRKLKLKKPNRAAESWAAEPEPVSSISDATTEEDVAFCLMMLSRDKWKKQEQDQEDEAERSLEDTDESEELLKLSKNRARGKYKCETCKKTFRSYQALGGHRASHKKIKVSIQAYQPELEQENVGTSSSGKKVHECPVCFRVFSSGQALGGHKRTHVTGSGSSATAAAAHVKTSTPTKNGETLIDLNLPAPIDDDDISQIELSAVSDAEFVNPIRQ